MLRIALFLYAAIVHVQEKQPRLIKVQGTVAIIQPHCGGAKLSDDVMNRYFSGRPYAYKTLYIRKGTFNDLSQPVLAKILSDSLGHFTLRLPKGKYCIVDDKKKDLTYYNQIIASHSTQVGFFEPVDTACLKYWLKEPDAVFTICENKPVSVSLSYSLPCPWSGVPCSQYIGPLPS